MAVVNEPLFMMPNRGFTLVEVMVTVALVAILFLVAAPLTTNWTTSADIVSAKGVLTQAIGRAKSLALRNQMGVDAGNSAAAICISSINAIEVRYSSSSATTNVNCAATSNTSTIDWRGSISASLGLKTGTTSLSCLCFDSKAQINTTATGCTACGTSTAITLSASGISDETVSIY